MKQKAYAAAGVDIDLGNKVKATLAAIARRPRIGREVLGKVGGFGGLFALDVKKYREPVLVASVDGVGTKLKIAFAMDRHDTIGADLVNHCVNDIAVLGAEPLFFLDYLGTGKLEPHVFTEIIKGFARACAENSCALIGGETAQMPGFYQRANTTSAAPSSASWKNPRCSTARKPSSAATSSSASPPAACTPTAIRWRAKFSSSS